MAKNRGPGPAQRLLVWFLTALMTLSVPARALASVWDEPDDDCHIGSRLVEPGMDPLPWPGCYDTPVETAAPRYPASINVDDTPINLAPEEPAPYMQNGRVLVPLRAVAEALGATVTWDPVWEVATVRKGDRYVLAYPGMNVLTINGWTYETEVPTTNEQGRLFVPVRYVAEGLGVSVLWNGATTTATITSAPLILALDRLIDKIFAFIDRFKNCNGKVCVDQKTTLVDTTPAEWEAVQAEIDAANQILQTAHNQGKNVFADDEGNLYVTHGSAAAVSMVPAAAVAGASTAGFAEGLGAAGLEIGGFGAAALAVPAAIIAVFTVNPSTAGMSEADEKAAVEASKAKIREAEKAQEDGGFNKDQYGMCHLKPGDVLVKLWPSQGPFFTDEKTAIAAKWVSSVLSGVLQVPPYPEFNGFRQEAKVYTVLVTMFVPCGKATANPVVNVPGSGPINAGVGGGLQYVILDWRTTLLEVDTKKLTDWLVRDWGPYSVGK